MQMGYLPIIEPVSNGDCLKKKSCLNEILHTVVRQIVFKSTLLTL